MAYFKDESGKFGAVSINPSEFRGPRFESLNDLVKSLEYDEYSIINPDDLDPDWVRTRKNLRPDSDFIFTRVK
ncbi:MAG: hypothetical protein HY512_01900 [Candidatus Aenigmarchaeota archaeon]|nr:hypothetical protein [Candidatus Aenigmarchaeota archaeon]